MKTPVLFRSSTYQRIILVIVMIVLLIFILIAYEASQRSIEVLFENGTSSTVVVNKISVGKSEYFTNKSIEPTRAYSGKSRFSMTDDWLSKSVQVELNGSIKLQCVAKNKTYFDLCFLQIGVVDLKTLLCSCDSYP